MRKDFIDRDLNGRVIEQKSKDSKSVEVEGQSRFCGHRFLLKTKLYGDKKCIYCGDWFHWSQDDAAKWVKNENIDTFNVDTVLEPLHCGKSHCDDYHKKYLRVQERKAIEYEAEQERRGWGIYRQMQKVGLLT